ncbi:MAG: class I SAM-dependent methyltransferase [Candidatus Eisenbacteria sp.]|nr:class I SAM-dependent methyltransferase [Candidatus Eisenbacteria bacterium]
MTRVSAKHFYEHRYYKRHQESAQRSARAVLGAVVELLEPRSVIDVGCGNGPWAAVARELGVPRVVGVDGQWVNGADLMIPREDFLVRDLTRPLDVDENFDLVLCLEVAADLQREWAGGFVGELTRLSSCVVFSSGSATQTHKPHRNRQPQSYWRELFAKYRYEPIDLIRARFWDDPDVGPWYRQNAVLFASRDRLSTTSALRELQERYQVIPADIYHPEMLPPSLEQIGVMPLLRRLPQAGWAAIRRRAVRS